MFHFCTFFDRHYIIRGLALYRSLVQHADPFVLWVLCFDDPSYDTLSTLNLPNLRPISLHEFEAGDTALLEAKKNRSQVEYYFTCTPSLLLYLFARFPQVDLLTYLDADLFFFSSPEPIYQELGEDSILIVGHRFPERLRHLEKFGIYNVGLLAFRNDLYGRECLRWWRKRCLEWCYDRVEEGRFADQKYLDEWPSRFRSVVVLQHKGAGLAPWNLADRRMRVSNEQLTVDNGRLVFFHFHGLKELKRWLYDPGLAPYRAPTDRLVKRHIYGPYIRELREVADRLSSVVDRPRIKAGSIRVGAKGGIFHTIARNIINQLSTAKMLMRRQLFVMIGERIL